MKNELTEAKIQGLLSEYFEVQKYPFRLCNGFVYSWECDFWLLDTKGMAREFEIKISKDDFKKDAKKEKHAGQAEKGPNFFYYVCPRGLIQPEEINKNYGLIWIWEGTLTAEIKKRATCLHKEPFDRWQMLAVKYFFKYFNLLRDKWIDKQITHAEYRQGLYINLDDDN